MSVVDLLSKIAPFTGSGQIPFDQWLGKLEDLLDLISPAPKIEWKVNALKYLLHGNARAFFDQQDEGTRKNYPAIVALLKQKFIARAAKSLANQKLYTVCQSHDQSVGGFANQIRELITTASIGDDPAVSKHRMLIDFIRGLKPSIRIMVKKDDPTNFDEALELATRFEGLLEEEQRAIPANTVGISYNNVQNDITQSELQLMREQVAILSDQLREANRVAFQSHEARFVEHFEVSDNRRCYRCRNKGHLARECKLEGHLGTFDVTERLEQGPIHRACQPAEHAAMSIKTISHGKTQPVSETRIVESFDVIPNSAPQDSFIHAELQEIKRDVRALSLSASVLITLLTGKGSEEFLKQRSESLEPETSMEPVQEPLGHLLPKYESVPAYEQVAAAVQHVKQKQKSCKTAVVRGQTPSPTHSQVNEQRKCYRCGLYGHLARNCKSEQGCTKNCSSTFMAAKQFKAATSHIPSTRSVQSETVSNKKYYRRGCYGHAAKACKSEQGTPGKRDGSFLVDKMVGHQIDRIEHQRIHGIIKHSNNAANKRLGDCSPISRSANPPTGNCSVESRQMIDEEIGVEGMFARDMKEFTSQMQRSPDVISH